MNSKLVLIDGNSIFYRAFFALPLLESDIGYSNAVYGFANILIKTIFDLSPTHIAVAFDVSKKTFRNDIYDQYKATRKPMPTELASQIPVLKEMLSLMNIKMLEKQGLEADDILGTIAHRFDMDTIIVTGDRDAFQLIDSSTRVCRTIKGISEVRMMDEKAIMEEYGLSPVQLIDLKALQGDMSDNIPGVPGVGEKTALTLMQTYGSLDAVYEHVDEIKGKMKDKMIEGKQLAYMSQKLAKINDQVDIACTIEECAIQFPFDNKLMEFFSKYKMRTLMKRTDIWKTDMNIQNTSSIVKETPKIKEIKSEEELKKFCNNITELAFHYDQKMSLVHLSNGKCEAVLQLTESLLGDSFSLDNALRELKPVFENSLVAKVMFDTKLTMHMLDKFGISINGAYFDVSVAKHLVDGNTIKTLEDVLFDLELEQSTPASSILLAKKILFEKMEQIGVSKLFFDVENPLVEVLFDMEKTGFYVDETRMHELGTKLKNEMDELTKSVQDMASCEFNLNSPKQLGEILFDKLHLPANKKRSTGVEELDYLSSYHPIVPLLLRYRKVAKLYSTYIDGLEKHIDKNHKIHTNFKQTLTTTGRLSSTEPNLQNIPIRTEESREIRSMFVASSRDRVLVDADYSQIELRLLAHFSGDPIFIDAFKNGKDIHSETACQIFGTSKENITPEMRRTAKVVNFGIIYGISDFGLANDLKISPKTAKQYIANYFEKHPQVSQFMKGCVETAKKTGRVTTILGRTRKMLDITASNYMVRSRAERASQNAPLQGSAADIVKVAMVNVFNRLRKEKLDAKLIMQVHDELIIDCDAKIADKVAKLVDYEMEHAIQLEVPMTSDVSYDYRWSNCH